ncbi:MAG TPA: bifunctional 23S rRNA (guanine(2069)-N(7))-methyltransferase RlmK/23S rRNA (guanine(2445)-N(2))-methyltransferase RlmL, partial [Xanthomonadales bacterium]|nr:bifunctional 23S rRNA (guanine(2069)-N(7))-methyltransferase RlmK/23S rRNA (guanine(2445)-N(2))-methyltransferase RlmL [Xanthomonadales bacterium]
MSTRYFAPCPKGLEYLLVDELRALGASEAREALAGVYFEGDPTFGYRACLWSRLASRVLLPLAEFEAETADALASGVGAIDWSQHMDVEGTLAIDAHGSTRGLTNAAFAALRAKDAIVDQFRERTGERPSVAHERPSLRLNLALRHGRAHLSIDLAGGALFMRGYRRGQGEAPLKENLAAAMLLRGRWPEIYARGGALFDPMCGAGTLLVEGAWMAADVAPGLQREWFGFLGWKQFDRDAWDAMLAEARERAQRGLAALRPVFFGADQNAAVLGAAKQNAHAAGVSGFMRLMHTAVGKLEAPPSDAAGLVITNPPYGERLGEVEALRATYAELGATLKRAFAGWTAAVITSNEALGRAIGLKPERRYQLYNGALECTLLCYDSITAGELVPREQRALTESATALKNRLVKNLRVLKPKLQRAGITCYRAYDADLPEYAAAIDVYTARRTGEAWLHVQEYAPPPEIPEEKARRHLDDILRVVAEVFAVPRERIALKTRRPQQRTGKYQRLETRGELLEVEEHGVVLLVNLFDYLDTGLFL